MYFRPRFINITFYICLYDDNSKHYYVKSYKIISFFFVYFRFYFFLLKIQFKQTSTFIVVIHNFVLQGINVIKYTNFYCEFGTKLFQNYTQYIVNKVITKQSVLIIKREQKIIIIENPIQNQNTNYLIFFQSISFLIHTHNNFYLFMPSDLIAYHNKIHISHVLHYIIQTRMFNDTWTKLYTTYLMYFYNV